jgi:hypothetical protein
VKEIVIENAFNGWQVITIDPDTRVCVESQVFTEDECLSVIGYVAKLMGLDIGISFVRPNEERQNWKMRIVREADPNFRGIYERH